MLALIDTDIGPWGALVWVGILLATAIALVYGSTWATAGFVFVAALVVGAILYYVGLRVDAWMGGTARRGY